MNTLLHMSFCTEQYSASQNKSHEQNVPKKNQFAFSPRKVLLRAKLLHSASLALYFLPSGLVSKGALQKIEQYIIW